MLEKIKYKYITKSIIKNCLSTFKFSRLNMYTDNNSDRLNKISKLQYLFEKIRVIKLMKIKIFYLL